jgi:hypothetical protein
VSIGAIMVPPTVCCIKVLGAGSARYLEPAVHHTWNFRAIFHHRLNFPVARPHDLVAGWLALPTTAFRQQP